MPDSEIQRHAEELSNHGQKIAVLENIASEIQRCMIGIEEKLDMQYKAYIETQGTLKAILDFKEDMKNLFSDHDKRLKALELVNSLSIGARTVWERFGGLIGGVGGSVITALIVWHLTKP